MKNAIFQAIRRAEYEKGANMYKELYGRLTYEEKVYPAYTWKQFRNLIVSLGEARAADRKWKKTFSIDKMNADVVDALSRYFSNDESFEKLNSSFSLHKGIFLTGGVGCGKTQLMELCSVNPKLSYTRHDCLEIANEYANQKEGGADIIKTYAADPISNRIESTMGQKELGRFYDDLGAESKTKHFGNEKNVMAEIIQERHKKGYDFHKMHFTSNLTLEEVTLQYGVRVSSRLKEMCNIIIFNESARDRR